MLRKVDDFLNSLTMYRLLVYGLIMLVSLSLVFNLLGTMNLPVVGLLISLAILLASTYGTNKILSKIWMVPTNNESWLISALILFFVLPPANTIVRVSFIMLAGVIAMASKFIIARHRKHIFNPVALAVVIVGLFGQVHSLWWIGSSVLWPFMLIYGLLIVRKIRKFHLFLSFVAATVFISVSAAILHQQNVVDALRLVLTSSPLLFLGTVMLTEPATMPPRRNQQMIFGAVVGLLYSLHWSVGSFYMYPETALVIGNMYAYIVSPKFRMRLRLKRIERISAQVYNYIFIPERKLAFMPGQYLEWTLPHAKQDARGNRRTFTIASSPTETEVSLGVKFYDPSSSYKDAMKYMNIGDSIYAGQLAGNFTLPKDTSKKLVFIAGGIGVTPFRSILKYLNDTSEDRDIIMFYVVSSPDEIAYRDVLSESQKRGIKIIPLVSAKDIPATWKGLAGRLDQGFITKYVQDFSDREFFISGPHAMVENTKTMLQKMGVKRSSIIADHFSGY